MKSPIGLEARIPVFDLFKDALFLLWAKRNRLLSMFLPIILVLVILDYYSSAISAPILAAIGQDGADTNVTFPPEFWVVTSISMLLSILLATTVHRFTLQDASQWPSNALRVPTRSDMRYLWRSLQIMLIAFGVAVLVMMASLTVVMLLSGQNTPEGLAPVMYFSVVPTMMIMIYVLARLSITLPEIAIGAEGSDLARAWRMSKGNGSRVVIVALVLPFLVNAPFLVLASLDTLLTNIIAAFGIYSMTLISITVLSLSYQFLYEFYQPQPGEDVISEKDNDDGMDA